jgi:hypothetical protein
MPDEPIDQPAAQEPGPPPQPDWFLQTLVNTVNNTDVKIGITLQVSGFLVSGLLIGISQYFDGFAAEFITGMKGDPTETENIRTTFSSYGRMPSAPNQLPVYIHMQDARFFNTNGNPIPGNRGVWWRGRISEVSGFVLGTLGTG